MKTIEVLLEEFQNNESLKAKLQAKAEEVKPQTKEEIVEKVLLPVAQSEGYQLTLEDIKAYDAKLTEIGELSEAELETVSGGGIKAVCVIANSGCKLTGEIDGKGGCILLGMYK